MKGKKRRKRGTVSEWKRNESNKRRVEGVREMKKWVKSMK